MQVKPFKLLDFHQIPVTMLGMVLMDKSGRRVLLMVSSSGTFLGCFLTRTSFFFKGQAIFLEWVGAQTKTELKKKKLRVEDALNATKVVGGGCTLLRLAAKVDSIRDIFENDEQKVGANIVKRALSYPMKLIAKNAGFSGSVVIEKVLCSDNYKFGYNAATWKYSDLMASGIPDKVKFCVSTRFGE